MKNAYKNLYVDCCNDISFGERALFVAMQGEHYANNTRKFMLIGRAVNGWSVMSMNNVEAFGKEAEDQFKNCDRWNWIESVNGVLYSSHDRNENKLVKRYCLDKKNYWTYTREIWKQLEGNVQNDEVWQKNIVWSNLYKISPKDSDNPDPNCQKMQRDACIEILKRELEICQPTHILLVTGYDWFEPFAGLFTNVNDSGKRNISRGKNKNSVYVEGTAMYGDSRVVIACRPEWRERKGYVQAIVDAFKEKN